MGTEVQALRIPLRLLLLLVVVVQDTAIWGLKMEALKLLVQLVSYFGKFISPVAQDLMGACWRMYSNGLEVRHSCMVCIQFFNSA